MCEVERRTDQQLSRYAPLLPEIERGAKSKMMMTCRGNGSTDGDETCRISRGLEGEATRQRRGETAKRMERYGSMLEGIGAECRRPLSENEATDRHENRRTYVKNKAH